MPGSFEKSPLFSEDIIAFIIVATGILVFNFEPFTGERMQCTPHATALDLRAARSIIILMVVKSKFLSFRSLP